MGTRRRSLAVVGMGVGTVRTSLRRGDDGMSHMPGNKDLRDGPQTRFLSVTDPGGGGVDGGLASRWGRYIGRVMGVLYLYLYIVGSYKVQG